MFLFELPVPEPGLTAGARTTTELQPGRAFVFMEAASTGRTFVASRAACPHYEIAQRLRGAASAYIEYNPVAGRL